MDNDTYDKALHELESYCRTIAENAIGGRLPNPEERARYDHLKAAFDAEWEALKERVERLASVVRAKAIIERRNHEYSVPTDPADDTQCESCQ